MGGLPRRPTLKWIRREMTLQDRFLAAIVKNNPDPAIGEYAQAELSGE